MNRYNIFILTAVIFIGIASCTKSDKLSLYVVFDSVRNIKEGSEVYGKNVPVGKVTDLRLLANHKVLVKIDIAKSLSPVTQDTFALVKRDYFGSQAVEVIFGKNRSDKYTNGDTVVGIVLDREPPLKLDSITWNIVQDSLITPHIRK